MGPRHPPHTLLSTSQLNCTPLMWYSFSMGVEFTPSADRHGIPREDAIYAMSHAEGVEEIPGRTGEVTRVYVGRAHAQTDRRLEVIAAHRPPRDIVIFHVMDLSDLYRHLKNGED